MFLADPCRLLAADWSTVNKNTTQRLILAITLYYLLNDIPKEQEKENTDCF